MGNRGSITVVMPANKEAKQAEQRSVTLFRHWGGDIAGMGELVDRAWQIARSKTQYGNVKYANRTPDEIIALLTAVSVLEEELNCSAYLGKDCHDGDSSDNGDFVLQIKSQSPCCIDEKLEETWVLTLDGEAELKRWSNKEKK